MQHAQRQKAPSAEAGPQSTTSDEALSPEKAALRGLPFAEQEAKLAPGNQENAAPTTRDGTEQSPGASKPATEIDGSAWVALVKANFAAWDKNGDGELGAPELEGHLKSGKYHGPELSALYMLFAYADRLGELDPGATGAKGTESGIARADLDVYAKTYPGFPANDALAMLEPELAHTNRKLDATEAGLFGADGVPDLNAVEQSSRGSCTFLAAVISMANNDPKAITQIVKLTGTSVKRGVKTWTFSVTLAKKTKTVVLTETDLLQSATAGDDGLWLAALEKAVGDKVGAKKAYDKGAHPSEGIERLTGNKTQSFELDEAPAGTVRAAMQAAIADKVVITCGIYPDKKTPGLTEGHAYAILAFDGNTVTIRDPYRGSTLGGNADSEFDKKAPTDKADGILELDFDTFMRSFSNVSMELRDKAAK